MGESRAFQDQGAVEGCFGCGADNPHGLRLKSYWDGDEAVAEFRPEPFHRAGAPKILYGGIIASLIDCHSCNFAIARICRLENRPIGSDPRVYCVTARLDISYVEPAPVDRPVMLRARLKGESGRRTEVECELSADGIVRARGSVLVVRVDRPLEPR